MSTTIDQNVVEMRFDNSHFERNVSQSMHTLNNFKQSLRFDGATKGIEQVGSATEAMSVKVSHAYAVLQDNIVRWSRDAIMQVEKALDQLTMAPVRTGFTEYETQINATQTILANTKSKGSTIDDVNKALEELNRYADLTIYNFTEMTRNIGTFTAAGIDLETSVGAIQGIANLAAVSGSTSQQASTAMYQLSQALSSGTVRLMDWNSVVNAGMGGEVFQNALKKTSEELKTGAEAAIEAEGSFRESLKKGWLTAEVLTETLKKFTTSGANEYLAEYTGLSQDVVESYVKQGEEAAKAAAAAGKLGEGVTEEQYALEHASNALAEKSGKNKQEIKDTLELARTATDAATKVKTLTQLWDVLKEAAQSGWAQSWKIIVGDFEKAKDLFTPLSDALTGFINDMSDARNRVLTIALAFTDPIKSMMEKLEGAGLGKIRDTIKAIGDLSDKLEYYQDVVNKVWRGDYNNVGDNPDRFDLLAAAGYDPRIVQDLVNKGYQYKLTVDDIEASYEKFGLTIDKTSKGVDKFNAKHTDSNFALEDCSKYIEDANAAYRHLTDEQLEAAGLTEEEIRLFRALEKESDRLGISIDDLADKMSETDGRTLLIDALKNFGDIITGIGKAAATAWEDIFNPPSLEYIGVRINTALHSLKEFSEGLRLTDANTGELNETGLKIKRTLEGIFAAVDIVLTVIGGPMRAIIKGVCDLLGYFNIDILDITANIGDAIVAFRDWIDSTFDFTKVFEPILPYISSFVQTIANWWGSIDFTSMFDSMGSGLFSVIDGILKWWNSIDFSGIFEAMMPYLSGAIDGIVEWWNTLTSLSDPKEIANHIVAGFSGIGTFILTIVEAIHSSITEGLSGEGVLGAGINFVQGFLEGIWDGIKLVGEVVFELGKMALEKLCEILGIHSPSEETKALGEFTIEGFIEGLKSAVGGVWDWIKDFGSKCLEFIGKIDWGAVFAAGTSLATVFTLFKLTSLIGGFLQTLDKFADAFSNIGKFFEDIGKGVKSMLTGIGKSFEARALETKSKAMINFAIAIGILAGAIWVLAQLEWQQIAIGVVAIAALAGIMIGLSVAADKLTSGGKSALAAAALLGLAGALLVMAYVAQLAGGMTGDQIFNAIAVFTILLGAIAILTVITKLYGQHGDKMASTLLGLSVVMLSLLMVAKIAGGMSGNEILNMIAVLSVLEVAVLGLVVIANLYKTNAVSVGSTLMGMAGAMALLLIVGKMAGGMTENEIVNMIAVIAILEVAMLGLVTIANLYKKDAPGIAGTLISMAGAMLMLLLVGKLAGDMTPDEVWRCVNVIGAFTLIIAALVAITRIGTEKELKRVGTTILAMSVAIGIMGMVAALLGFLNADHLIKGVAAVTMLGLVMTAMIWATRGASDCKSNLIVMTIAIAVMAAAVAALSFIEWQKLIPAAAGLALIMGMFALMVKMSSNIQSSMATLIVMTVAIGVLAGSLWLLAGLPVENTIAAATSLSILLLAVSGALAILGLIAKNGLNALGGVIMLTAMAVPMLAFIGILALMSMVPNVTENVIALSGLMIAMTAVLAVLALMGTFMVTATAGIVGLTALAIPMLVFVGILALMSCINDAATNVSLLILLMGALTTMLGVLALIGPMAITGVSALGSLIGVITVFGALVVAVGALMTQFPMLQEFLDAGIPILEQLAHALGSVVANLITGFMDGIADGLPGIAEKLSLFAVGLIPFMTVMQAVPDNLLSKVGIMSGAILALTATDMLASIASLITNGSNLAQLGTDLSNFMINALPFILAANMIDPSAMTGVKILAEAMGLLTSNNIVEGLTSWFTGGTSLEAFGKELALFGPYMKTYADSVAGIDAAAVEASANAASSLSTMATNLPDSGGFLADLMGDNTMSQFGADLVSLGTALNEYSAAVTGLDTDSISTSVTAAQSLSELATNLPDSGGFLADLMGDNTMSQFGADLVALGTALSEYSGAVTGLDTEAIDLSVTAAKSLSDLADGLPDSGGFLADFMGDNTMAQFGEDLVAFGAALVGYSNSVTGLDTTAMSAAVTAAQSLSDLASNLDNTGGVVAWWSGDNDLATFGDNLKTFGTKMKNFSDEVSGIDAAKLTVAVSAIKQVVNFAVGVSKINFDGLGSLSDNLAKVSKSGIDGFIAAFVDSYTDVKGAGESLVTKVIEGANAKSKYVVDSAASLMGQVVTGVRAKWESFKNAGKYLGSGLIEGINAKKSAAYTAGYALGLAAVNGEKAGQQSNSPSKLTILAGNWLGEGLIIGMQEMGKKVYESGNELGNNATNSVSSTIAKIAESINSDLDVQPTIRPVIDLSDVKTGVNAIGSMFGNSSVGVSANIGAVSSMMNRNGQNGRNDDVIAELSKLNRKMDNIGNTTYQINGVTYDDGSNIASAVQTITRAALRERRM